MGRLNWHALLAASGLVLLLLSQHLLAQALRNQTAAQTPAVAELLARYQTQITPEDLANRPFNAETGREGWYREQEGRSCTSCHGNDLAVVGRHQKTGKIIEPMARSVNPARLTDVKHIRKWLKRNCKWTYGRECTSQEKGDFLLWLSSL